jgi:serine/threonine-protein kinase
VSSVHDDERSPFSNPTPDSAAFLPPRWTELHPLLDQLLDAPSEERAARVVALSGGNAVLQRQLEQLLAESDRDSPLLNQAVAQCFDDLAKDEPAAALPQLLAGRYRVGRELGRGGMASVYLARDEKHGRDVAIKVIKSDLSASLGHERFLREIEIAARLRHPNIVPLYDSGETNGSLFFVMPYEDGQSLRERIRRSGPLPIVDTLSVLRDVARALCYAHEHGVVHRDIKPDNVLLSGGAAVVTDFGIAKAVSVALTGAGEGTLTQAGTVIGTPAYMAPEQATGDTSVDHRADIYSFGCLAYELFAGHPPFQEKATHLLIAAHLATAPRPIAEVRADVPQPVADLITRCLAKAPAERPHSARELLPALEGGAGASTAASRREQRGGLTKRARTSMAVAGLAVAAALVGYCATTRTANAAPVTLSVLPFENFVGDSATDLFADGLSDEVASALTRVPGVLVKSRTGARRYRGQRSPDVTEAGARLKADYIVTAVVREEGGRWTLSVDLDRAADASTIWANQLVVEPNEQATAAESVANSVAAALRRMFPRGIGVAAMLSPHQRASNPEAYRLYVLGQGKLARRGQSVREAVDLFRQAIKRDSLFAPAYAGLSMALGLSVWFHSIPPSQVREEMVSSAQRALLLDSTLSQPHIALGLSRWLAYDWKGAASEMQTAIRRDPADVEARLQYARVLYGTGRFAEALKQLSAARDVDPASAPILSHLAGVYYLMGQMDSAVVEAGRALETDSANITTLIWAAAVYVRSNRLTQARALLAQLGDLNFSKGFQLAKAGDIEGARRLLRAIEARRPAEWGDESRRAFAYLGLGDTASALTAFERATAANELWPLSMPVPDPTYDSIRKSARFRELLERVGLSEYTPALTR